MVLIECQVALIQILYNLLLAVLNALVALGRLLGLPSQTDRVKEALLGAPLEEARGGLVIARNVLHRTRICGTLM